MNDTFYAVNYRLSMSTRQGNLTALLRTILEIESEIGLLPVGPIYVHGDKALVNAVLFDKRDVRKLLAGRLTEDDYLSRHSKKVSIL